MADRLEEVVSEWALKHELYVPCVDGAVHLESVPRS